MIARCLLIIMAAATMLSVTACDRTAESAQLTLVEVPVELLGPRTPEEEESLISLGEQVYHENSCFSCHSTDDTELLGPSLRGIAGEPVVLRDGREIIRDSSYLYRAIADPSATAVADYDLPMPAYPHLDQKSLVALVVFIESIQ